jgi:hypothetical protein
MRYRDFVCLILGAALLASRAPAQTPTPAPKPQPDVLILNDDEKLLGHFVGSSGSSLTFKSNALGSLTIDWSKVKELHAGGRYAVVGKNVALGRHTNFSGASKGKIDVTGKSLTVTPGEGGLPTTLAVVDTAHVVEEAEFDRAVMHEPGLVGAWKGTFTGGASLVEATQQSRVFTGAVSLVRAIPVESWMFSRNRTILDFSVSDGFQLQPGEPRIKTEIIHGDAERDEYFDASRVYGFAQAVFDRNFSQGLNLAQQYGGGIGWTVVKNTANVLDLKGGLSYLNQQFQTSGQNQELVASTFSEGYTHRSKRGIVFTQQISATPTWNNQKAWQAAGSSSLTVPVYKRLSFTLSVVDNYLHDPSAGFKKNSFQAATGLTYSLK